MIDREFVKELRLDGELFDQVREDFNFVLQRLLGNMQEKGADSGALTLKLEIDFDTDRIQNFDPDIEGETRTINKPKFKHKITSTVQIKDEKGGNMDTEMELVMDEETGCYVLQPVANTGQRSIFDADFRDVTSPEHQEAEVVSEGDGEDYLDGSALPGRKVAGLLGMNPPEDEAGEEPSESPQTGGTYQDEDSYAEGGEEAPLDGSDILFGNSEDESEGGFVDDGYSYEDPDSEGA